MVVLFLDLGAAIQINTVKDTDQYVVLRNVHCGVHPLLVGIFEEPRVLRHCAKGVERGVEDITLEA
jgi:hypothetical protein